MPSRLKRFQNTGELHLLTVSCHDRQPYFSTPQSRKLFEEALESARRRYVFFVYAYVVMPEHVHLLVSEPKRESLSQVMQALKTSVSKQSKPRPFWLTRYYDFNLHASEKRTEKIRYIHRNPVKRGLVNNPEDWEWSSFRHYFTGEKGRIEIESEWTAGFRQGLKVPEVFERS
jgi:putative transposase